MPDATLVLVAVCGLLCVGGGLVAVFAYVILRRTGRTLIETFGPMTGIVGTQGDAPRRRRDLRSRAQSVDFDSHIAQQGQRPPPSNPFPGTPPPAAGSGFTPPTSPTTWTPPETPFDAPDNLRRSRRPRKDDAEDPDVLDDFLG
jgi:hypothetical protein